MVIILFSEQDMMSYGISINKYDRSDHKYWGWEGWDHEFRHVHMYIFICVRD